MKRISIKQAIFVTAVIIGLATGATYALLQSQLGIVKDNIIQTAIANLQVSSSGTNYSNTMEGYAFGNLIPGGQPTPMNGYPIYLKNVGTTPLDVKLGISSPVNNPDNVDLSKVKVILTPTYGGAQQIFTLQELIAANATGGKLVNQAIHMIPTQVFQMTMQVSMDSDAISGPGATLSNVNFNFGGVAVN
jgi:hypothetical protein